MAGNDEPRKPASLREIFLESLEYPTQAERKAYLDRACAGDPALRERAERIIAKDFEDEFLEPPAIEVQASRSDPPHPEEEPGAVIGRYKLLQRIGEGGCGAVYLAEQEEPVRRRVALKVIKAGMDTRRVIARFEAERQALALMDHPNIARVLDGGTTQLGRPYFVMELVSGVPITEFCDRNRYTPRERLALMIPICHAIQSAHQKGIIHRDIKPSNVLITLHDDEPVPKVIDFGIAKALSQRLTEKTLFTRDAALVGTPAYMSPEQAEMSALDADTRSDVYSLGVLLYELLTGDTPIPQERLRSVGYLEMQRMIAEEEPPKPSARLRTLPPEQRTAVARNRRVDPTSLSRLYQEDLDWIVMKCLEKERSRRYDTPNDLAADLKRHFAGEPVVAAAPGFGYRLRKLCRRHRPIVVGAAAVAAALVLGSLVASWQAVRAARAEAQAQKEAVRAREEALQARRNLYAADMTLAGMAIQENDLSRARPLLARHKPAAGGADLRGWEWRYFWRQCQGEERFTLRGHDRPVSVAFVSSNRLVSAGWDGSIHLWDLAKRQPLRMLNHGSPLQALRASSDGQVVAAADENAKRVLFWEAETLRPIASVRASVDTARGHVAFLSESRQALVISDSFQLLRLTLNPHAEELETLPEAWRIRNLAITSDGSLLALSGDDRVVIRRLNSTGEVIVHGPAGGFVGSRQSALCFSPNGRYLALSADATVHLVDAETGQVVKSHRHHRANVTDLAFTPDGELLISGAVDQLLWVQEISAWRPLTVYQGHEDAITSVAVSPDGEWIASASRDGLVKLWNARPSVATDPLESILNRSPRAHFSHFGESLVSIISSTNGSEIIVNQTVDLREAAKLTIGGLPVLDAVTVGSGETLAVVRADERVELWSLAEQRQVATLLPPSSSPARGWAIAVPFHWLRTVQDGRRLVCFQRVYAVGAWTPLEERGPVHVAVFDAASGRQVSSHDFRFPFGVAHGELSPDGEQLAVSGHDGQVTVLSLKTGAVLKEMIPHRTPVSTAFSPSGDLLATASHDGYLKLWDTKSWVERGSARAHRESVFAVAFHPNGNRIVTGGPRGSPLTIWDAGQLRSLGSFHVGAEAPVNRLRFADADTLLAWAGSWTPDLRDRVVVLRAAPAGTD